MDELKKNVVTGLQKKATVSIEHGGKEFNKAALTSLATSTCP